jgi:hypothetical protein
MVPVSPEAVDKRIVVQANPRQKFKTPFKIIIIITT